ncbi:MAG: hypothetical protein MJZ87_09115 [Bacteroidales bacterium]|nr:hypothetical protein [Bacteroidales bacterium]
MFSIIGIILFLFLVALPCGIIFLLFHIPKTLGRPKLGRWLGISVSVLYGLFMLSFLFSMTGWVVFPKHKVRNLLQDSSIELTDRFSVLDHENIGFDIHGDTYESFTIEITSADKQRIIDQIKSESETVVLSKEDREDHNYHIEFYHRFGDVTEAPLYYDAPDEYLISVYESPQKEGYVGKYHWISLKKRSNEMRVIDFWE